MEETTPEERKRWAVAQARRVAPWLFAGGATPTITYTPAEEPPADGGVYRGPGFSITLPGEEPQHSYRVFRGDGEPASAEKTHAFGTARSLDTARRYGIPAFQRGRRHRCHERRHRPRPGRPRRGCSMRVMEGSRIVALTDVLPQRVIREVAR